MKFHTQDIQTLQTIIEARRDVRGNRFLDKKIKYSVLRSILKAANSAPSVGYSQPWRFVIIKDKKIRQKIFESFQQENQKAKKIFESKKSYHS